jgi:hypothetical protein
MARRVCARLCARAFVCLGVCACRARACVHLWGCVAVHMCACVHAGVRACTRVVPQAGRRRCYCCDNTDDVVAAAAAAESKGHGPVMEQRTWAGGDGPVTAEVTRRSRRTIRAGCASGWEGTPVSRLSRLPTLVPAVCCFSTLVPAVCCFSTLVPAAVCCFLWESSGSFVRHAARDEGAREGARRGGGIQRMGPRGERG